MRRLLSLLSPIVAVAITAGSVSALASRPDQAAADTQTAVTITRSTVVPDLQSVSRILQATSPALERIDASTVPESVQRVLRDNGAVLLLPIPSAGGAR